MDFMLITTFCGLCFIVLTSHILSKTEDAKIEHERKTRNRLIEIIAEMKKG